MRGIDQEVAPIEPFRAGPYRLTRDGGDVATVGRTVVAAESAPNEKYVAVLSTKTRPSGLLDFWGGSGVESTVYYHQVFTRDDGRQVGDPVALKEQVKTIPPSVCWSEDSGYVVYLTWDFHSLWVVPAAPHPATEY